MDKSSNSKPVYDLEKRTFEFAKSVRKVLRKINPDIIIDEDKKQLTKASGSVGANYIEANESLSKKDFSYRIKICRKEAKESGSWLRLIEDQVDIIDIRKKIIELIQEADELKKIFSSIYEKSK